MPLLSRLLLQHSVFRLRMRKRPAYQNLGPAMSTAIAVLIATVPVPVFVQGIVSRVGAAGFEKQIVQQVLTQAWSRKNSPSLTKIDAALSDQLILSGTGGVAWNNLKHCQKYPQDDPEKALENVYRFLAIQELRDQCEILNIGRRLSSEGITPLTFKGRVLASYYSPTYIRPTGDLDIVVREEQFDAAITCLKNASVSHQIELEDEDHVFSLKYDSDGPQLRVDLHKSLCRFGIHSAKEIFTASKQAALPDPSVFRMPSLEHHIRIVTIHFLRHGGWRPLWLCDVAALMDAVESSFNWELCLGENRVNAEWVVLSMKLAEQMLGARSLTYPDAYRDIKVPDWVARAVNKEWHHPNIKRFRRPRFLDVKGFGNRIEELKLRWPNPLVAMTSCQRSLLKRSIFLYQSQYFLQRCRRFIS